jgi:hypothetical protein
LLVAETAKRTWLTMTIMEANHRPARASNSTCGSLMLLTSANQKSARENVGFAMLPFVLYIVPAKFTIWTTN